ncbi:DUF2628 domain-containing protein [Aerococcus kribbianus]|uniref:DUF2628 domain-containing protein n=1 Tax=Aerococcus kribbianus TaxID=2999064 RepID=A0A9X3FPM6_9LACT|nr:MULTISPECIES: DUF2628 domain-containing protein [unclassified Aerococcus]MCZ0717403.1 DUF2628 domain-containing protein [Aerococcus sp. YH-aer221]MCZ0725691.1 DUF2628 domain-containing protein [Aerococcus sp. YH-aer222]
MEFGKMAPGKNALMVLNPRGDKRLKLVKAGFSWTTFFFGFFVPLFRRDWKWALIIAVVQYALASILDSDSLSLAINVVLALFYNKVYINDLMNKGYQGVDHDTQARLESYVSEFRSYS